MTAQHAPRPTRSRWQPLRAGLVDLFYYDVEEFHFHDGRLLLRGNNGTGKSKVLALTVPFLLDGELAAHRVEPDGDRAKRMDWNLLLGGKHPHSERLGYTWLEFGRQDADGHDEYRTLGCGLKAVTGRGIARHWFFVTDQRIGSQLDLVGPTRSALTREKLKEALEGHGLVYDTATDYRRAVDETLFRLGQHRYEALVNLLIQLRQPQLSKRPDEKLLSRALTEALPPLDPALLSTVADAFRGLDEERAALQGFDEAKVSATAFLRHYTRYAQIAAKRSAAAPRQTHSHYERLGRELGDAETAWNNANDALHSAEAALADAQQTARSLETRREALRDSPAMRDALALEQAARQAADLAALAESRRRDLATAQQNLHRRQRRADEATAAADTDRDHADTAHRTAADTAADALIADAHTTLVDALTHPGSPPHPDLATPRPTLADADPATRRTALADAERAGAALERSRSAAVTELARLLDAHGRAVELLQAARAEVDRITGEQQEALDRIAEAEQTAADRADDLVAAYRDYLADVTQFRVPDPDDVLDDLRAWAAHPEGPNPAGAAVADAVLAASHALAAEQATIDADRDATTAERTTVTQEITRLESGGHDAPPPPHTRDPDTRRDRDGAPLWRVVDFRDAVPDADRAAVEAALEAAGILDAWLTPAGHLLDPATGDTLVVAGEPAPDAGLATVLTPAVDRADPHAAPITDEAVDAVLRTIGLAPGPSTWVSTDGRYGIGVLTGRWHKPTAEHIGDGAREAARRARLTELRARLATLTDHLADLATAADALAAHRTALATQQRAQPQDSPVREAHVRLAAEHAQKRRIDQQLTTAGSVVADRTAQADTARRHADDFAHDVGLPADPAALAAVRDALGEYRLALAALWPAVRAHLRALHDLAEAHRDLAQAAERHEEAAEQEATAREQAQQAAERHRVLQQTAGAAVEELHRRLAEVATQLAETKTRTDTATAAEKKAIQDRGIAEGRRATLQESITTAAAERDQAITALRSFATTGLLAAAVPDLDIPDPATPWAPNPAVTLARAINAALDAVDDAERPWELIQQRVSAEHKILTDALSRHGHSVGMTVRDGIIVVDVIFQGHTHDVPALVAALEAETAQRAVLLSAKEREILENHLVNEVAGTLQELITDAEAQVQAINDDLRARPTSTGMHLRLQWRPSRAAPDGLDAVRNRLLRQTSDAWNAEDRSTVGAFLQAQIEREHAADAAGGWLEQLSRALDYRAWHEFVIQRHQDGQWRPASGPASGGERVLAASLPLFAAASSFYNSAGSPDAPRLIALDEAFAGVDDDSRAKCLGLLAAFDLDVVMTSEREWGCYPQVPGLAISQLARRDGIDAVLVTPWRWDGRQRRPAVRPATPSPTGG